MSDFTYEFTTMKAQLETYEWDNVWWEHAETDGVPRVLYIGDSISCVTRRVATEVAKETIFFDGFGTSKAVDNPLFERSLKLFAEQQKERSIIVFNNGLHGWHLDDETEYAKAYEGLILFLKREFMGTPLALLSSTHVADPERDARVVKRNLVVSALAKKHQLHFFDFYKITKEREELLSADGVHFQKDGYRMLAEKLVEMVREVL